jgi:hypothetical protein
MKIYLDDVRKAPTGWKLVETSEEAISALKTGNVTHISLDHDLGDDEAGTGYDVILWIEREVFVSGLTPPNIKIHTANISARKKMELGLSSIIDYSQREK